MGQWTEVNQLEGDIRRAEASFRAACEKAALAKRDMGQRKAELLALYDRQDAAVKVALGPKSLVEDEKTIVAKILGDDKI